MTGDSAPIKKRVMQFWRQIFPKWIVYDETQKLGGAKGISIWKNDKLVAFIEWTDVDRHWGSWLWIPDVPGRVMCQLNSMISARHRQSAKGFLR